MPLLAKQGRPLHLQESTDDMQKDVTRLILTSQHVSGMLAGSFREVHDKEEG